MEDYILNFMTSSRTALAKTIVQFYQQRNYVIPTPEQAKLWHDTEIGEAAELLLYQDVSDWIRNHPDEAPRAFDKEKFGEELGDAIMMLIVAGLSAGVDPIACLIAKIRDKSNFKIDMTGLYLE